MKFIRKRVEGQPDSSESYSTNFHTVAMETAVGCFGGLDDVILDYTPNIHTVGFTQSFYSESLSINVTNVIMNLENCFQPTHEERLFPQRKITFRSILECNFHFLYIGKIRKISIYMIFFILYK